MIQALCTCKERVFVDQNTGHKFNSQAQDDPHRCKMSVPTRWKTWAYCLTCSTAFKEATDAHKHVNENMNHRVHYVDPLNQDSRDAALVMGVPQAVLTKMKVDAEKDWLESLKKK